MDPDPPPDLDPGPDPDLTILLLGNSGVGKSASGNTILGRAAFDSRTTFSLRKTPIKEQTGRVFGKLIRVIDTPGILESEEQVRSCCQDVLRCVGPRLFLLVVKTERFTLGQSAAVEAAIGAVGDQGFSSSYLLFTGGDTLKNLSVQDFVFSGEQSLLPEVVRRFSGRFHLFNNEDGDRNQVRELLCKSGHLQGPAAGFCAAELGGEGLIDPAAGAGRSLGPYVRRIVLIGPAGSGKSSSGNTLLGFRQFEIDCDFDGVRKRHGCASLDVEGGRVTVVDSAGPPGEAPSLDQLVQEIRTAMDLADPGPHVFVIVVKIGRLSPGDSHLLRLLTRLFDGDVSKHAAVLFTHGDALGRRTLQDQIRSSRCVSELVSRCGGRLCVVENTRRGDRQQVTCFLRFIDDIIRENGGRHCSLDAFDTPDRKFRPNSNGLRVRVHHPVLLLAMLLININTYRYFY